MKAITGIKTGLIFLFISCATTGNQQTSSSDENIPIEDVPGYETEYTPFKNGIERRRIYTRRKDERFESRPDIVKEGDRESVYFETSILNTKWVISNGKRVRPYYVEGSYWEASYWEAWIQKPDGDYLTASDGVEFGPFDRENLEDIYINPDRKHWVAVINEEDKGYFFVSDEGKKIKIGSYIDSVKHFTFSPDGKQWIAGLTPSQNECGAALSHYIFFSNGKKIGPIQSSWEPVFSPDGKQWAMLMEEPFVRNYNYYLLTSDGKKTGPFDKISDFKDHSYFKYNPDRKSFYAMGRKKEKEYLLFSNGKSMGPYENAKFGFISPDGKQWAAIVKNADDNVYILTGDGKKIGPVYAGRGDFYINFDINFTTTPYGNQWIALTSRKDWTENRSYVHILTSDGKIIGPFSRDFSAAISPDGKQWMASILRKNPKHDYYSYYLIFNDGKEMETEYKSFYPTFSRDGKRWVLWNGDYSETSDEFHYLFSDGKKIKSVSRQYSPPSFSPDGKKWVLSVRDQGNAMLFSDGLKITGEFFWDEKKNKQTNSLDQKYFYWFQHDGNDVNLYRRAWSAVGEEQ